MKCRSISTFIGTLLVMLSLAGCGSEVGEKETGKKHADSKKKVENLHGKIDKVVDKMSEKEVKRTLGKSEFKRLGKSERLEKIKNNVRDKTDARRRLADDPDGIKKLREYRETIKKDMEKEKMTNIKDFQKIIIQIFDEIIKEKTK